MEGAADEQGTRIQGEAAAAHEARLERSVLDALAAMNAAVDRELDAILSQGHPDADAHDDGTTTVRSSQRAVDVLRAQSGGWVVRIPGWNLMSPFPTKLEAVTYAEEWLFGRL